MSICQGFKKNKVPCTNKPLPNSDFCIYHNITYYNESCPVCLTSDDPLHITSCLHRIHLECCKGLNTLQCPLCQQIVTNYPLYIEKQIKANELQFQKKLDDEDRLEAERIERESVTIPKIAPYHEVAMAIGFLINHDIPIRYIPTDIHINIYKKQPLLEGTLYNILINYTLGKILNDIDQVLDIKEDIEDDPFIDENEILSNVSRIFDIKEI
jgi:hypothetical protein